MDDYFAKAFEKRQAAEENRKAKALTAEEKAKTIIRPKLEEICNFFNSKDTGGFIKPVLEIKSDRSLKADFSKDGIRVLNFSFYAPEEKNQIDAEVVGTSGGHYHWKHTIPLDKDLETQLDIIWKVVVDEIVA